MFSDCLKHTRGRTPKFFDEVLGELRSETLRLFSPAGQQVFSRDAVREAKVVLHVRGPLRERLAIIYDEHTAPGSRQVDRRRNSGDSAANHDDIPRLALPHNSLPPSYARLAIAQTFRKTPLAREFDFHLFHPNFIRRGGFMFR